METIALLPDLQQGQQPHNILVTSIAVQDAVKVVDAFDMRQEKARAINMAALRNMADAHKKLVLLADSALLTRADNPHHNGDVAWIWSCEEQVRQFSMQVGGSFQVAAIGLCDRVAGHCRTSPFHTAAWVKTDAKRIKKEVDKLINEIHTLSQKDDQANQQNNKGEQNVKTAL